VTKGDAVHRSALIFLLSCSDKSPSDTSTTSLDTGTAAHDTSTDPDPFADEVVEYLPGEAAGFGQDQLPDIVLGSPEGAGDAAGSTHVLSLGCGGSITLAFDDIILTDGAGPDLLIFENPFIGFAELGQVAVSDDLKTWTSWPCDTADEAGGYPGCAGVAPVLAASTNDIDPTDPEAAGGDAFDLAELGVTQARYVRITDAGTSDCLGITGGFDLDAVAVIAGEALSSTERTQ